MAGKELIIDDDYCRKMALYCGRRGLILESVLRQYIAELTAVNNSGIDSGETAQALKAYISYAENMKNKLKDHSITFKETVIDFLNEVDEADEYLF